MRALALLASLTLILAAGCIKEDPVDSATIEEAPPAADEPAPATPTPTSPSSAPPASNPPSSSSTTQPPPPEESPAPAPAPAPPRVEVEAWNGSLTGVGAAATTAGPEICCASVAPVNSNADVAFDVPAGLKGIVVELVWSDAQFDLDLLVTASDYAATPAPPEPYTGHRWLAADGAPAQPVGRATIVITDADSLAITGTWGAHASAKGPANEVAFTMLVSLFYDEPPATDYTAVI